VPAAEPIQQHDLRAAPGRLPRGRGTHDPAADVVHVLAHLLLLRV